MCTIALVSPASRSSCRNTLLSTTRAIGLSPKLTLLRPTVVWHSGMAFAIARTPSIVSSPERRSLSMPVEIGSTSGSNIRSAGSSPCTFVARSYARLAIDSLRSAVRAIDASLSSSIDPITSPAP